MSNSNKASNKTQTFAELRPRQAWLGSLLVLGALTMSVQGVVAQQTAPIKPCVVEKPCTSEPASPSKGTPASKRTLPAPGTSSRKRTSTAKPGPAAPATVKRKVSETLIDESIPGDLSVEKVVAPYSEKVRALEVVIGKLEVELTKGSVGGGNLGYFVTDGMRDQSSARLGKPVMLAVTNSGGLRKNTIATGDLRAADIFELLPFENALVEVDLTGEQLQKLINVVVSGGDALSGARVKYRMNASKRPELVSARLLDSQGGEVEIDPNATYSVITIDYLLKLGSGRYSILQEAKNVRPLGVTIRDALMDYVKAETAAGRSIKTALDDRFVLTGADAQTPASPQR